MKFFIILVLYGKWFKKESIWSPSNGLNIDLQKNSTGLIINVIINFKFTLNFDRHEIFCFGESVDWTPSEK